MKKYIAGVTITGAIAFILFRVADDQLGITQWINKKLSGAA